MLLSQDQTKVKKLFNSLNKNDEFEIMFNNYRPDNILSLNKFVDVTKYLKWRSDKDNIKMTNENSLDIIYMDASEKKNKQNSTYRVSIDGNENVNNFLRLVHLRSNHIIFSILMTQFIKDKNYSFIKKIKDSSKIIDIDDYDIRFRVSSENEIDNKKINELANLPVSQSDKIKFRYKNRISLILIDNEKEKLSIDLTYAKMAYDIKNITNGIESFEVEIDYMNSNKLSDKTLSLILKEVQNIKKVIDGSQVITQKNELEKVKRKYKDLVYGSNNNSFNNL